ncbi:aminotransferase class I/II-fold pyridoxal phosphate-dependent enzyme, partial [Streptococcus pyogenes]
SPSNPTGAVYPPEALTAIGRWALENGVWVITDEIYEHLVYDDTASTAILRVVPELADTTIVLNGVAKTYAMTGWRVGWMSGP